VLHDSEEGETTIREVTQRQVGELLASCITDYEVCLYLENEEILATGLEDDDVFLWFREDLQVGDALEEGNMVMEVVAFDQVITVAGVTTSETVVFRVTWKDDHGSVEQDDYEYWAAGLGPIKWVDARDGSETLRVTEIVPAESIDVIDPPPANAAAEGAATE
jgi:hypothetical protein